VPFYRYECRGCGGIFRVLHRSGKPLETRCPNCGGREADRLPPRIGVIYKGSGYYSTDHRSKERGRKSKSTTSETTVAASDAEPSDEA